MATILVVDDHALNRQFLVTLLGYGGHRLLEAADGVEALKLARAEHPDLVITDILMPHMDGHELATRMRADTSLAGTPLIFYTATYRVREARALARECGVKWVLPKPSDPETILKVTQEALGLPAVADTRAIQEAPASEPEGLTPIGNRFIDYLSELEMAADQLLQPLEHGRTLVAEQDSLRQLSQKLFRILSNVQALGLRLSSLVDLGLDLAAERDPATLLQTFCRAARNICIAKYAAIGVPDDRGQGLRYFFTFGLEDGAAASPVWPPPGSGLLATLIQQHTPRRLSGLDGDPQALGLPAAHPPVHSLLWVPIISRERTHGWLCLADKLGDAEFSEIDEQMALTVASQLAVAYENLLLYEEVRRMLRARTILAECNHVLAHATEESGLLGAMCRIVVNTGGYRMAWIGVGEPDGNPLVRLAARAGQEASCADGWALGGTIVEDAACPAIQAIRDGLPHVVPDILTDPVCACERECKWACGSRSVIALPLKRAGRPFGAITIYEATPGAFEAEQIAVLEELADDIAYGVTSLREQAARRRAEQALRHSEARLREAQEIGRMGHWELDPGSGAITWSAQVFRIFDRDPSLGPPSFEEYLSSYVPDEAVRVRQLLHEILATGERMEVDLSARLPGGRSAYHHLSVLPEKDAAGRVVRLLGTVQDITELKRTEESLRRVNRTLRLLSECNQILIRTDEVQDLLDGVCRAIVEIGGYRLAWVGMAEHNDRRRVRVAAIAGDDQGFLDRLEVTWDDSASGRGPMGTAIREQRITLVRHLDTDPDLAPWRDIVRERGLKSAISLPLKTRDGMLGALAIYAAEEDAFDTDEVKLLSELADDLAYGIEVLQARAARRRTEEALRIARFSLDHAAGAILWHGPDARINYANESACRLFGYTPEEMCALALPDIDSSLTSDKWQQQWTSLKNSRSKVLRSEYRTKAGKAFPVEVTANYFTYGDREFGFAHVQDISERLAAEERIRHLANFDPLTELPNRALVLDRLQQTLHYAERYGLPVGVLFADLDRFKLVNDTLGHTSGDELLKEAACRLGECVRDTDTVARVGGDEFVIVVPDQEGQGAALIARRIVESFTRPFALGEHEFIVTCSIGMSVFPKDGHDAAVLLRNADMAMYRAKESGRNTYQFFASEMNAGLAERVALEQALRGAARRDELLLHYQPQVDLATGRMVAVEALIRWRCPGLEMIPPGKFIPVAEEMGLIGGIGEWVLRSACAQRRQWLDAGLPPVRVAVNLSAQQFRNAGFPQQVAAVLQASGANPECLEIELTESMLVQNAEAAIEIMRALKAMGVHLSLDDFGTGYSSLSYLRRFPIDALKIDQSFVRNVDSNPDNASIATAVISMAHSMNLGVVAEGVETERELDYLIEHGCDLMQGYYFSKPLPPEEIESMLRQGRRLSRPSEP